MLELIALTLALAAASDEALRGVTTRRWSTLPPDMRDIVYNLLLAEYLDLSHAPVDAWIDTDPELIVHQTPAANHVAWASEQDWDYRGQDQVDRMAEDFLAGTEPEPVVLHHGAMLDGRHRTLAATKIGRARLPAVHLEEIERTIRGR